MCNRDNACDVAAFPDEKSKKRSGPKNQAQIKIKFEKISYDFSSSKSSCKSTYLNSCKF